MYLKGFKWHITTFLYTYLDLKNIVRFCNYGNYGNYGSVSGESTWTNL